MELLIWNELLFAELLCLVEVLYGLTKTRMISIITE